jgi:hypothetical protein
MDIPVLQRFQEALHPETITPYDPFPRSPAATKEPDTALVIELLLKNHAKLNAMLRDESGQRALIPKFLGIAMGGFALFGIVATAVLNLAHHGGFWLEYTPQARWDRFSVANLTLAYSLGMIAANGICLPTFYFYTLLAGLRISMVGVVAHALKGMAAGAVALVGILPIYVALTLYPLAATESHDLLRVYVMVALALPFLAGTWGAVSLYQGFVALADMMPEASRECRTCMLRQLILAWSGCYTFVTPLVIYSIWLQLSKALQ